MRSHLVIYSRVDFRKPSKSDGDHSLETAADRSLCKRIRPQSIHLWSMIAGFDYRAAATKPTVRAPFRLGWSLYTFPDHRRRRRYGIVRQKMRSSATNVSPLSPPDSAFSVNETERDELRTLQQLPSVQIFYTYTAANRIAKPKKRQICQGEHRKASEN